MREPTTSQPTPPPREKGRRRCLAVTLLIFLGTLLTVVSVNPAVMDFFGDPPRRPSKVHCVCGPEEDHVNDRGCQVVVENGVTTVTAQTSIRFALFADSDLEFLRLNYSVYECLGFVGSVRPRLWWNWETTKLITARGTDADLKAAFHLDELPSDRTQLVPRDELLWAVSWIMAAHYHFTFQCGLYQAHLFQSLFPHQTGHPLPPIRVDLMSVSDWVQRHVTPAQRELFDTVVPSIGFSTHQNTTYASRFATFGFYWASPMTYRPDYKLFPGLKKTIPLFAASLQSRLIAKYGDVTRNESQVLFSNRPAGDGYDGQLRSRGIPAFFVTKLRATIETALPLITNYEAFDGRGSLQAQFHQVRRHRFVYGDEGSFFTSIILAPPRSTWVLVYNHSRSATDWKHCNFHATVASTLPFIKLVIFIIDKSQPEPPQEELLRVLRSPWHPGVVYIGADVNGNQLTMPPTRRPPPANLARVQKVFYINDKSNHSAAAAP